LQDVAATVLATTSFSVATGPPYPFELSYYPPQILPGGRYALSARITHEERLLFINTTHIPAFPDEGGSIDILVSRAASSP
jgi:putative lipoprotein